MPARCSVCGWEASDPGAFRRVQTWVGVRWHPYCGGCWRRRQQRQLRALLVALFAWAPLSLALTLLAPATAPGKAAYHASGVLLHISLFLCSWWVAVLLYAAGQGVLAWLAGLRLYGLHLGNGPALYRFRLLGLPVEVRPRLIELACVAIGYPSPRWVRLRWAGVILAGPLTNAFLAAVVVWWMRPWSYRRITEAWPLPAFGVAFIAANALMVFGSVLPYWVRWEGQTVKGAVLQLLSLPFLPRSTVLQCHQAYFSQQGADCLARGRYDEALTWYQLGLVRHPEDEACAHGLGMTLLSRNDLAGARRHLAAVLTRPDLSPTYRGLVADAAAMVVLYAFLADRPPAHHFEEPLSPGELLAEGLRCCEEALRHERDVTREYRWSWHGTRGCLLVEQGRVEEGADVLRNAAAGLDEPLNRVYCLAYLAVASTRKDRWEEGAQLLRQAQALYPGHPAVKRALREWFRTPLSLPDVLPAGTRPGSGITTRPTPPGP